MTVVKVSTHSEVLELPGVVAVKVFVEDSFTALEWAPVAIFADDIPADEILDVAEPYLGEVVGEYGDWSPLHGREAIFDEDLDRNDPWQFKNFRVS